MPPSWPEVVKALDRSPSPLPSAATATTITSTSPESSISVSTTLTRTDSLIPRKLRAATSTRNRSATGTIGTSAQSCGRYLPDTPRASVAADAMPEHMTANATMNVTNGLPNALFT